MNSLTEIANRHHFNKSFTTDMDTDQIGLDVITPATGKRVSVKGVLISTEATSGRVRIYFGDDADNDENTVATIYVNNNPGYVPTVLGGAVNAPLKVSSDLGGGNNYFLLVNYKEE